jgi:hypothetical protein
MGTNRTQHTLPVAGNSQDPEGRPAFPPPANSIYNTVIRAEELRAVEDAEELLTGFSALWPVLPVELQPSIIRQVKWALTIAGLNDPLQLEIRLAAVAKAAGLPKQELRRQIFERVEFCQRYWELHERNPREIEEVGCNLILN